MPIQAPTITDATSATLTAVSVQGSLLAVSITSNVAVAVPVFQVAATARQPSVDNETPPEPEDDSLYPEAIGVYATAQDIGVTDASVITLPLVVVAVTLQSASVYNVVPGAFDGTYPRSVEEAVVYARSGAEGSGSYGRTTDGDLTYGRY